MPPRVRGAGARAVARAGACSGPARQGLRPKGTAPPGHVPRRHHGVRNSVASQGLRLARPGACLVRGGFLRIHARRLDYSVTEEKFSRRCGLGPATANVASRLALPHRLSVQILQHLERRLHPLRDRVVLVRQHHDADALRRHVGDIGAKAIGRAGLVDQHAAARGLRRLQPHHRVGLEHHLLRTAGQHAVALRRPGVHFPGQPLHHVADLEVAGAGRGQRAPQGLVEPGAVDVGHDEAHHVGRGGLHTVGLGIQHAGRHAGRFAVPGVAIGIVTHARFRHLDVGAPQPQRGEQGLLHQYVERLPHAARGQVAEQADAGIRVLPVGPRGVAGTPGAEIVDHLAGIGDGRRKLQRQPAGRIGAQVQQAGRAHAAAREFRQVLRRMVGQRQVAAGLRISGQRRGEGLADRADLEQRVGVDLAAIGFVGHAVVEVVLLAANRNGHGHARHVMRLHHRLDRRIDDTLERTGIDAGMGTGAAKQRRSGGNALHCPLKSFVHIRPSRPWCAGKPA
ncbi:hypothetical protein CBM2614_B160060 [Cupriavidus taiwanensis]|uniref:Uncharacterized protein n=1 Tax=Cupriavidus taiwanensis TaxID=164546 RepID=A0A375E7F4_9BURK|nr:hypothetical protein CBM2614_B160060 [Cupriavidus taiwanensis]SOZ68753.1 hypothetical protein CBM2613_B120059 [Cupriavidus taiwanensis]